MKQSPHTFLPQHSFITLYPTYSLMVPLFLCNHVHKLYVCHFVVHLVPRFIYLPLHRSILITLYNLYYSPAISLCSFLLILLIYFNAVQPQLKVKVEKSDEKALSKSATKSILCISKWCEYHPKSTENF